MKAKSINGKSPEEIQSALKQCMDDGFKPTLAIVFMSVKQDRRAMCEILHNKGIDILGATSCGEFIDGYHDAGSAVILLLDIQRESYTILFNVTAEKNLSEVAGQVAREALQKFKKPAFIVCSTGVSEKGEFFDGKILLHSIENVIGPQVNIYGGMAGDDGTLTGSYVFTYEKESDEAIATLVLDEEKISLHGMAISGWKPLGIVRTATKSENGWLYSIDDQPALEMYLRYLGKEQAAGDDEFEIFDEVGLYYPFLVEDAGDPVLRTPIQINKNENAIKLDFDVPQGTKLKFSMPPDLDIVENVLEKANDLKNNSNAAAEALLIFSCYGRLSALGPLVHLENEGLHNVWKVPMAGFFTYGEYGRSINGNQEFHSTTCCWVALKEK